MLDEGVAELLLDGGVLVEVGEDLVAALADHGASNEQGGVARSEAIPGGICTGNAGGLCQEKFFARNARS